MSFNDWLEHEIDECVNSELNSELDDYTDEFIDRLYKLTTIKANLSVLEQKMAAGNILSELMEKMKDLDINELIKNNPNFRGF